MKRQHANKILTANDNLGIALSTFVIYALHDSGIDQRRQQLQWEGVIAERLPIFGKNDATIGRFFGRLMPVAKRQIGLLGETLLYLAMQQTDQIIRQAGRRYIPRR
ncbi:hypothetical protein [Pseudomonas sp. LB3P38]|uniref:hypothetical protein n=1 Tax=Pseudomonas lyxosi TaxID=3398358 RepID=UPI0039F13D8F